MRKITNRIDPEFISILLLLAFGLVAYADSFTATFHLDDYPQILQNDALRDPTNLSRIFSCCKERFLPFLTLAVNRAIDSVSPLGYHIVNFFIHYFASLFLYFLFLLTWKTPAMQGVEPRFPKRLGAFFAASIFLLHPLQTQSVTYIVQRSESMAGMFYLATLVFYLMARCADSKKTLVGYSFLASVSAVCALFSKETAITLPAMLIVYELCFFNTSVRALLRSKLILFTLAVAGIIVAFKLEDLIQRHFFYDPGIHFSRTQYLFTQFSVLLTYLRLFFWPAGQNIDWDYPLSSSFFELKTFSSFLCLVLLLAFAFRARKKLPFLFLGIVAFFITLAPTSSIIPIKDVIFEHRMYLAVGFLAMACVSVVMYILERATVISPLGQTIVLIAFISVILPVLSGLTYVRNQVWLSELSLWEDSVKKSPNKARPHNNYGIGFYLLRHKMNEQAKREFEIANRLAPGWEKPYHNLAVGAFQEGDYQRAIDLDLQALEIKPDYKDALYQLGRTYKELGQWPNARSPLERLVGMSAGSRFVHAYLDLIEVYLHMGLREKAMALAEEMPPAAYYQGVAYYTLGDFDKAKYYFSKQMEQNEYEVSPYLMLSQIHYLEKNYQEATRVLFLAEEKNPRSWAVHYNLALLHEKSGKYREAVDHFQKIRAMDALSLAPTIHLVRLYNHLGESAKRLELTRKLLGLQPDSEEFHFLETNGYENWNYTLQGYAEKYLSEELSFSEERTMAIILCLQEDYVGAIERYQKYLQTRLNPAEKRRIEKELERLEEVLNGMEPLAIPS